MLRRSLQNYAKVKASSQASRGSSEYASCKENVPVLGDGNFMAVPQTASNQPGCDRTPTSRLDQKEAAVLSSQSSKGLAEVALTPMSASGSVDSTRGTPVLFANKNSLSMFGSPALISRDQEQASNGENIKVVIRVRPLQIKGTASEECLRRSGSKHVTLLVGSDDTTFTFDHVAGPQTTQEQFFRVVGRPMVENVLSGYNSCIFAYGQTGSGKTHTMLGQLSRLASGDTMPEEAGLIPRIFAYLFACIEDVQSKQREGREVCFLCKCSFLEIYNEVITDLFNPAVTRLHIREGLQQGVHVEGLLEQTVTSAQAVLRLLCDGAQNRHVAATKANADSSRSHCVFKCVVESKCIEDGVTSMKTSCLNLVDLAGSERQKVAEGKGERVKEAGSINRSLASLGLVIKKLVEGNGPGAPATQQTHIPYQDSRLTFLLQDSLGGNAKTVMVANVNPAAACLKETHSTLGFAHRARMIRNKAVVNEDTTADALLLQKENERLRKELEMYRHLQQACTPTPQRESPLVVAKVRQEAELAEAEVAAAWAGQLAAALELNQDLEDNIVSLRQQNASLKRERKAMEGEVRQMQADMQALVEADLIAQQRAQAAEAQVEAVNAQSRQQHSHPVHAEAQVEEVSASLGDAASMQDASLMYNHADVQLISQVACLKTQLQNGNTHAAELKKRLAGSEAERDRLAVAAQELQQAMQQQSLAMQNLEQDHQASLSDKDALRMKSLQQKAELQEAAMTIQQLQGAAAGLAEDLQSARSAAGRHVGQHTALRQLSAEHEACTAELAAKATAMDELNASMAQLRTELAASTAQQAQHEQHNTQQQAEFVGQVLQELQVLEAALVQKAEECESYADQHASLKAQSDMQSEEYAAEHSAQASAAAQLQRDLDAQHVDLTEKLLALEAQVAYKQHKFDALQKEVSSKNLSRGPLQADLVQSQQQGASQTLLLESKSIANGPLEILAERTDPTQKTSQETQTSFQDSDASNRLQELQQQLTLAAEQHAEYKTLQEQLMLEADVKLETQMQASQRGQEQLEAAADALKASRTSIDGLESDVARLQSEVQASLAKGCSFHKLLELAGATSQELNSDKQRLETALASSDAFSEDLQKQLDVAEAKVAASAAERLESMQATTTDQTLLHELQAELAATQEDKAALLAVPQADAAAVSELQQAVWDLQAQLTDHSNARLSAQAAAQAANTANGLLLSQLAEARQAVKLAEGRVHDLCSDHMATQEQLEQDRDSLMEEVLSAKARAADQERTVQSLRVAAEATAREKILLTNQLDSTEQQLAIQAQELLGQQQETQRLQAAQKDQAVYLKKAQLKGSSNEHGLRGLQQRLQEALQDKKSAELAMQSMQARLQEAELAVGQAEIMGQQMRLHAQKLQPDGTDRLGIIDNCQHGLQASGGSVHVQHQSTQTSLQAEDGQDTCCHNGSDAQSRRHPLPEPGAQTDRHIWGTDRHTDDSAAQTDEVIPEQQAHDANIEQQLSEARALLIPTQHQLSQCQGHVDRLGLEHETSISALQDQLTVQTAATVEAQAAAQRAQHAMDDCRLECSQQLDLQADEMRDGQHELVSTKTTLQAETHALQLQQAECRRLSQELPGLEQVVASVSHERTGLTQQMNDLTKQLSEAHEQQLGLMRQLGDAQHHAREQQSVHDSLDHQLVSSNSTIHGLQGTVNDLQARLAATAEQKVVLVEEMNLLQSKCADSKLICDSLSAQLQTIAEDSACQAQAVQSELTELRHSSLTVLPQLRQQLQEAQEAGASLKAAAEQLQCILDAAQARSTQLEQKNDRLGEQLNAQSKAHSATKSRLEKEAADLTQQLRAQAEAHSAELSHMSAAQARAQSRAEQLLTELQAVQQSCQALVRQAGETEAREAALKGSLQDRDDLILDLDNQIKALEVQITGAFAEHEAKLGQQQEALARQGQKGLATMQTRINALQATLAADSAQHAAAYADLQCQNERLKHDKESAYGKVAALQRQAQSSEGRALGAEQTVAALQQDLVSWQARYKKKDCELASQTSKVAMMQSLQQSAAEAQAGLAVANSKVASGGKALSQAQQQLHQMHDAYRRREGEVQRWKGLASQARAEGQSLQAKRDEEAALYADQVQQVQEKLSDAARSSSCSTSPLLHKQLAQLLQERDAILARNHQLTEQLEVTAGEQNQDALLQQQHVALTAERVAAVQAVQQQLEQAKLEHAAVMSQLRALHSSALEEVRRLRLNQKA
ncbi:hypothetical protein WJX77_010218 [Trebouxia sp. C0004]